MHTDSHRLPGLSPLTLTLTRSAQAWAQACCQGQHDPEKIRQLYLNALAVHAVAYYLTCLGFDADKAASQLCHPAIAAVLDVADLPVQDCGTLECRPVLGQAPTVFVPWEARQDRSGYVVVALDEALQQATILGFADAVPASGQLHIPELRSLAELPTHLDARATSRPLVERLSDWWQHQFGPGWQSLEVLLGSSQPTLAWGLRAHPQPQTMQRAKLFDLGVQLGDQAVVLLVAIAPSLDSDHSSEDFTLWVQLHPAQGKACLPPNLSLMLCSIEHKTLQTVQSREQDNYIQLKRFQAALSEGFEVVIAYGDTRIVETFQV